MIPDEDSDSVEEYTVSASRIKSKSKKSKKSREEKLENAETLETDPLKKISSTKSGEKDDLHAKEQEQKKGVRHSKSLPSMQEELKNALENSE